MIGVVLGNGPSKSKFVRANDMYVIGCNTESPVTDMTVILDEEVIMAFGSNTPVNCILGVKAFEKAKELRVADGLRILKIVKPLENENAGHIAAKHLLDMNFKEIEIWGCDSIFKDTIESSTDSIIPKHDTVGKRFYTKWREEWDKIIYRNQHAKITIKGE